MLLEPSSIAVIGASAQPQKLGHYVLENILTQGYAGSVFPINPKESELMGVKTYPSITTVPTDIDMAIIVTPANTVLALAEECGKKGVRTLVVITAGFAETGSDEGRVAEKQLKDIATHYGMTLIGPNCLGVLRPSIGLNASFALKVPPAGSAALISQSGALAVALMDEAAHRGIGFSLVASIGNKAMMDETAFLTLCEKDPLTRVIGLYIESITHGPEFLSLARRVARTKPIVLIKSGGSKKGRTAVSSHTGSLAGNEAAIDALCLQAGLHRAKSTEEFLDLLLVLSTQPPLLSRSVAIITNAGGPGVMAADAAERERLTLPTLEEKTRVALAQTLPPASSLGNPIDVLGDSGADRYEAALHACADDPSIDGIVVILTPQVMTPAAEIAQALASTRKHHPLIPIVASFMGHENVQEGRAVLRRDGIPCYETPERAVRALASLVPIAQSEGKTQANEPVERRMNEANDVLEGAHGLLSPAKAAMLLSLYGCPLPKEEIATNVSEALALGNAIGYPIIAKISSPDILHKTDIGGVKANIQNDNELTAAYESILTNVAHHAPNARMNGMLIQQFLPAGREFIVGAVRDAVFGPLIMAGLGGIYTELFADTSFRIAPIDADDCYAMLAELKAWKLLMGLRGAERYDIDALAGIIERISVIMMECPSIQEIDMNPVIVYERGVMIADAKVVVGHERG